MIRLATKQELEHIAKDPVRPHISKEWRTRSGREVYVLERDGEVAACICVAYMDENPLFLDAIEEYMLDTPDKIEDIEDSIAHVEYTDTNVVKLSFGSKTKGNA